MLKRSSIVDGLPNSFRFGQSTVGSLMHLVLQMEPTSRQKQLAINHHNISPIQERTSGDGVYAKILIFHNFNNHGSEIKQIKPLR